MQIKYIWHPKIICSLLRVLLRSSDSIMSPLSILWLHIYTMRQCLYHESMWIPWFHVSTMSPCQYHEFISIIWVLVYTLSPCSYQESLPITRVIIYESINLISRYTAGQSSRATCLVGREEGLAGQKLQPRTSVILLTCFPHFSKSQGMLPVCANFIIRWFSL